MILSDQTIAEWELYLEDARKDVEWISWLKDELYPRRHRVSQELLSFLNQYLQGEISTQEFQTTFDRKTRKDWDVFGQKGMSGAMFLNMLVKYIPDEYKLTTQLKQAIQLPESPEEAQTAIQGFLDFLETVIASGQATKKQLQSARTLFFLSAWWHIQKPEQWAIFYLSARRTLERKQLYDSQSDLASNYLQFQDVFISLSQALNADFWELEQLCARLSETKVEPPIPPQTAIEQDSSEADPGVRSQPQQVTDEDKEDTESPQGTTHSKIQWMLAKIGRRLGCRIWIARNDHSRRWNGQTLGSLSIDTLPPLGLGGISQKIVELVDVVWLTPMQQVVAVFEVEHTTSIYSGLLRMSDLGASCPNLNFPFYIVSPQDRISKVKRELSRPTFQMLDLHNRCGFFSFEDLEAKIEHILEWGSEPLIIDRLASKIGDIDEEE